MITVFKQTLYESYYDSVFVFSSLLSLKLQIWILLRARSFLTFRQTIESRFSLKLVRDMIIVHSQFFAYLLKMVRCKFNNSYLFTIFYTSNWICLVNISKDDIFADTSFLLQYGGKIIHIPVIFSARLSYVFDQKDRTSRILVLSIDHIIQLAIDPLSHEILPSSSTGFPSSMFTCCRVLLIIRCSCSIIVAWLSALGVAFLLEVGLVADLLLLTVLVLYDIRVMVLELFWHFQFCCLVFSASSLVFYRLFFIGFYSLLLVTQKKRAKKKRKEIDCEKKFGRMKSVNENYYKMFVWKLLKATTF